MGDDFMVEIVFMILFLIPAVLGIAEILHIFKSYFLKPKKDIISYKIIILTNNDPVNQFLYVAEQCLWQGDCFNLVVVHSLLSLENYIECEKIVDLNAHINEHHGFCVNKLKTVLYGVCKECASK